MNPQDSPPSTQRRGFIASVLMMLGLVAGYGMGALHFFEYLVPLRRRDRRREMFIGTLDSIPVGASLTVTDPIGQEIAVTRTSGGFNALSSKCPHLGCKVHFSPSDHKFICPCHMGIFDANGIAISGPPAKENKNLPTFEVRVDSANGWVFVMVPGNDPHGL